ncbi:MAG: hypothetical protein HYX91_03495 [Chloroflexi bacterium]|nr:hypothetical protein [Chloroflexota bacterium]
MKEENVSQLFSIQTHLTAPDVLDRIERVTASEFQEATRSPEYKYYGTITGTAFHLCNKKYGPYSSGPWIKGEVSQSGGRAVVTIETEIEEQLEMVTKILYPVLIAFGLLVMVVGLTTPEHRQIYAAVAAALIASPFVFVAVARHFLKSMQGDEVKQFGKLLSGEVRQIVRDSEGTERQRQEVKLAKR